MKSRSRPVFDSWIIQIAGVLDAEEAAALANTGITHIGFPPMLPNQNAAGPWRIGWYILITH